EAARHCAPSLDAIAVSDFDIVLRLKAPLPARATITRKQLRRALRDDVDTVLRRLCDRLAADKSA
ncbi:MAG TPA: hypothetical protein VEZ88_12625, partial [Steroidobacteraceae bacterium]|nr:hypothetical protein [Steroidobacteraceae bacterium]